MDRLLSMQVFEKIVSEGGFAAAARALDMSPAVVSRLVGDLEGYLDTRLIQRTTRKLTLTESGITYLDKVKSILQDVDDATVAAQNSSRVMAGTLQVLATPMLAAYFLAPLTSVWRDKYPEVMLGITVDPFSYLRVEEFDLTLLAVEESFDANVVARVLGRSELLLCAAPSYLGRVGTPRHPRELPGLAALRFPWHLAPGHANGRAIRFYPVTGNADPVDAEMKVVLQSLSIDVLLRATIAGTGLCLLAKHLVEHFLRDGRLVQVLPDWRADSLTIYAALPTRKFVPARVTAMLEFVTAAAVDVFPIPKR
jgi:DNA-binding transcriptional LysR family regulator